MSKWIIVLFGLVFTVNPAFADDRAALIGTWKLVSWDTEWQDGSERAPIYGKNPKGYIIFTAQGRMMAVLEAEVRKVPQTDEESAAAFRSMTAYSGVYSLEGDKWVTKVDVSSNPAWHGTNQVRFYKLDGDQLHVTSAWQPNLKLGGKVTRSVLVWERVK
jgi:hypothetical protein